MCQGLILPAQHVSHFLQLFSCWLFSWCISFFIKASIFFPSVLLYFGLSFIPSKIQTGHKYQFNYCKHIYRYKRKQTKWEILVFVLGVILGWNPFELVQNFSFYRKSIRKKSLSKDGSTLSMLTADSFVEILERMIIFSFLKSSVSLFQVYTLV